MKLFFNPASPFVRKVLIVAAETGQANSITIEPVALTPVNPSDAVIGQNPLGKIPALVRDNGNTLYDSRVICDYLNSIGDCDLYGQGDERWQSMRLEATADGICDAAVVVRYETFVRPEAMRWGDWIEGQKNKFRRALTSLEAEVAGFENRFDIGTIAIAVALDYLDFRYPDEAWRDHNPGLAEWHKQFVQRPSFDNTRPHDLQS